MSKNYQKTICFLHYGIGWKDGVNIVVRTLANQIQKQKPSLKLCFLAGEIKEPILKGASYKVIAELLPKKNKLTKNYLQEESLTIAKKIAKATQGMKVVVIENPFLGIYHLPAMIGFSIYASQYKPLGTKVFFRIHDLYADDPQYPKNLQKFLSPLEIKNIVRGKGVDGFLVVNHALKERLIKEGISREKIFYLANGTDATIFNKGLAGEEQKLIRKSLKIPNKDRKKAKILLYPVRVVLRKNIEEAILLTYFIREVTGDNYILVISGKIDKHDRLSRDYYKILKEVVKAAKFPIIFTKGRSPFERKYNSQGKIKEFGISDLYQASEAIVMTSFREGFGYPFLECWFSKKIVIGRRIQNVIDDFEKSGLKFPWLYRHFLIEENFSKPCRMPDILGGKLKSKESFERAKKVINILKNEKLKKQILGLNKTIIMRQVEILEDKKQQKQIIKANLKVARKVYEISKVTKRFLELVGFK